MHEDQRNMLEVIAGAYDADDPEECARREALEEAGVRLSQLEHVACAWPTPANSTERIDYFLAPYSSEDRIAPGGGLEEEKEYISVCEIPLSSLKEMVAGGRIRDGKTLILSQALQLRHPYLFL
jgi:nudix-type nucleoside diphosphatase (YffH/AdpP family)